MITGAPRAANSRATSSATNLEALYGPDHVGERHRRRLVAGSAVLRDAERAHRGGVHDPRHARRHRRLEDVPGAVHVGAEERGRDRAPRADSRRPRGRPAPPPPPRGARTRGRGDRLPRSPRRSRQRAAVAARAREHAHAVAVGEQLAHEVGAHEAGAAGHQRAHRLGPQGREHARHRGERAAAAAPELERARQASAGCVSASSSARPPRSRPSGPRSAVSSAGTDSAAPSDTARTTDRLQPAACAAARMAADSMSTAAAPVADAERGLGRGRAHHGAGGHEQCRWPPSPPPRAPAHARPASPPASRRRERGRARAPRGRRGPAAGRVLRTRRRRSRGARESPARQAAQRSERRTAPRPTGAMRRPGRP